MPSKTLYLGLGLLVGIIVGFILGVITYILTRLGDGEVLFSILRENPAPAAIVGIAYGVIFGLLFGYAYYHAERRRWLLYESSW